MIGKSTGRGGELHHIIKKFDHLTNDISNVGNDMLYTLLPIRRYLPLSNSIKIKEWFELKQGLLKTLEKLAVGFNKLRFDRFVLQGIGLRGCCMIELCKNIDRIKSTKFPHCCNQS